MTHFLLLAAHIFFPCVLPEVIPSPREMKSLPGTPFPVTQQTRLLVMDQASESILAATEMFSQACQDLYGVSPIPRSWSEENDFRNAIVISDRDREPVWNEYEPLWEPFRATGHSEGYVLQVTPDAVYLLGDTQTGAFYGIMTLLQVLGEQGIPCLAVRDWPLFPIRAAHGLGETLEKRLQYFASLKLNMVIWESSVDLSLDDPEILERQQEFFGLCRRYCIEPVPGIQAREPTHRMPEKDALPTEEETTADMKSALQAMVRSLAPRFVHIGDDHPEDLDRDFAKAENMVEEIVRCRDWVAEIDPEVRVMMWADAVNPLQGGLGEAAKRLPKDLIQCVRFYGTGREERLLQSDSLSYFTQLGFECIGSPWYKPQNVYEWGQSLLSERQQSGKALGMIYTSWSDVPQGQDPWSALEAAAEYSWSPDKPFPLWLAGLNKYFGSPAYRPSLQSMWKTMAERLNETVVRAGDVAQEWKHFNNTLQQILDVAPDSEQIHPPLSMVRPAYSAMTQWILAEEHAYWEREVEAQRMLRSMEGILAGLLTGERKEKVLLALDLYDQQGIFPSSIELFDVLLVPKRPFLVRDGMYLSVPYTVLPSEDSSMMLVDLGSRREGITRVDFSCQGAENFELIAGDTREEMDYVLLEGRVPIVTSPPLFLEEPLACRFLLLAARPREEEKVDIGHLRITLCKPPTVVKCPLLDGSVTVDGRMDEEIWSRAARLTDFVVSETGRLHPLSTECRIFVTQDALYVGFRCQEPAMERILCRAKQHDGAVDEDDCVALFLNETSEIADYAYFVVNAQGVHYDRRGKNEPGAWNPAWEQAAWKGEEEWTVEMSIPLESLKADGFQGQWDFNACRIRRAGEETEFLAYAPTGSSFHAPNRFATLIFPTP